MAVNVSYENRIGYYTKVEKWPGEPDQKYKNWICHANCMWADIYFYKLKEDTPRYGKKGEKMAQLIAFWSNPAHLEDAIKNCDCYRGADNFHFFADQMDAEIWKAVKILAKYGKTVAIEPKQK